MNQIQLIYVIQLQLLQIYNQLSFISNVILLKEDRVNFIAPANYEANKLIDTYIKALIDKIYTDNIINKIESKNI